MSNEHPKHEESPDFSLMLGGPLYQLYLRSRLARPPLLLVQRRVVAFFILTWLPLLLLTVLEGTALSGIQVPFLYDIDVHSRFVVALTLLIGAEVLVHQLIRIIVNQFIERDIITVETKPKFAAIVASNMRLRNSVAIEIALIVIVITLGHWSWQHYTSLGVATWYTSIMNGHLKLTSAGYWFVFVSLPIFQFVLLRWYFRLFIWYRFLWQVARLPLRLNSLHPDRAGGLGFLANSIFALGPFLLSHTIVFSGMFANRIWHAGASLLDFKFEIVGLIIYLIVLTLTPLTFFCLHLLRAKQSGGRDYGIFASHYVNDFSRKWLTADAQGGEQSLGTADIQALADLCSSFALEHEMRAIPFSRASVMQLSIVLAAPFVPLLLTLMPLEKILSRMAKIIFL